MPIKVWGMGHAGLLFQGELLHPARLVSRHASMITPCARQSIALGRSTFPRRLGSCRQVLVVTSGGASGHGGHGHGGDGGPAGCCAAVCVCVRARAPPSAAAGA